MAMDQLAGLLIEPVANGLAEHIQGTLSTSVSEWSGIWNGRDGTSLIVGTSSCTDVPCSADPSTSTDVVVATSLLPTAIALALAVGLAVGVGVGVGVGVNRVNNNQRLDPSEISAIVAANVLTGLIPPNVIPFPNVGPSFADSGGCGDSAIRARDGRCYSVLTRGPCSSLHWITVDPADLSGGCRPRLCGRGRVYLASDGLCHDVSDAPECSGGRRFYYSAYGDPICDCPVGQFPFPGPGDRCVPLFTRGPCPSGRMVAVDPEGGLSCRPVDCPNPRGRQLVRFGDGRCYQLGTRGPCSGGRILGFDILRNESVCVDLQAESPYFTSPQESAELERNYNQLYPYNAPAVFLSSSISRWFKRRQGLGSDLVGIVQFPSAFTDPLLSPCRPGARNGNNFKCTNPLIPLQRRTSVKQAVRPGFTCRPGQTLTAAASCQISSLGATCGPSYRFVAQLGTCRQSLFS